jgi:hypothetical protein
MAGHTVAADACDGTAAGSACAGHTIACKADHEGGSITCNADGTYTMAACTRIHCLANQFAVGPTLYTAHGTNYVADSCAACPTGTINDAGDDPDGAATICEPDPSSALMAELTLDKDIATIALGSAARATFEAAFASDVSWRLSTASTRIPASRVLVLAVRAASVAVEFAVLADDAGAAVQPSALAAALNGATIAGSTVRPERQGGRARRFPMERTLHLVTL